MHLAEQTPRMSKRDVAKKRSAHEFRKEPLPIGGRTLRGEGILCAGYQKTARVEAVLSSDTPRHLGVSRPALGQDGRPCDFGCSRGDCDVARGPSSPKLLRRMMCLWGRSALAPELRGSRRTSRTRLSTFVIGCFGLVATRSGGAAPCLLSQL